MATSASATPVPTPGTSADRSLPFGPATATVLLGIADATGALVFASPQLVQFTGLNLGQLSAEWVELVHAQDRDRTATQWQQAQASGQTYQIEFRLRRHDGQYRWVRSTGYPQLNGQNQVQQWIISTVDIEELRGPEAADSKPWADFSFLAELIPQLVWTTDPTGYHTYFNQRWTDYTGYTLADSIGDEMWNNLLHPDDRQRARQVWGHSLATGEFYEIEYRFKSRQGDYRWFLGQALPVRNEAGEIVKWFGTCTDIHDQKMQQLALRKREQDFMTLANAIPQLAWMADETGSLFWYNDRWFRFTGTTHEQMMGWGWQSVQHPDYVEQVTAGWKQALRNGEKWEDTFPLRRHDGEFRWFLSRALPVRDEEGRIVRWCGTNTDITEQKQLQDQLERAYSDLEAKVMFRTLDLEREVQELRQRLGE
ncbi:PAS domain S-box-containing protein [Hymenobacter luteus]|uniref:histidine kinase n=2 Tax=Hymenobacter TaxID=89966 RepID=A0A7W9WCX0_9BACT|nr:MULTISPECIES: PAS domain-containing protein [Hymenobacter]MBB4600716.1 PAS domain S-box-containing protein [Hymenobacter latericoloratus]MBB6059077.1 PAS domain S-box-containing protein [Hymenobacter luteus]